MWDAGNVEGFDRTIAEMLGVPYPPERLQQLRGWLMIARDLLFAGDVSDLAAIALRIRQVDEQLGEIQKFP